MISRTRNSRTPGRSWWRFRVRISSKSPTLPSPIPQCGMSTPFIAGFDLPIN
ncbi:unnamed protein product [Linum tenue]|uniref:Uncharacterized protein n=1 Tax=Linum tenue TaxID=586396 RepID=A0AAV0J2B6_9ROSI|nr:unnamed protein product [Linum tenue]CAI0403195.1 unnamed protein product [Linum tenue]